jgi:2-polyprenyl-6-methoxyphenol hydroxylase-like FAD-dependent oxidoreductase
VSYDVIVVGARCAGASTAMLLARQGHRVLLVDRMKLPSDIRLSTHLVWQAGAGRLADWGLLDAVRESGCPALATVSLDLGPFALVGRPVPFHGTGEAFAPRRHLLDAVLQDAAVAAGAELRDDCTVEDLVWGDDRVVGVRCRAGGTTVTEQASIVVGADGIHSRVARLVDAPEYNAQAPLEGTYFSYWSGVSIDGVAVHLREGRACYAWNTNDDLALIGVNWPTAEFGAVRNDIDANFFGSVESVAPGLAEALRGGERVDQWIGTTVAGFYRQPYGPGWALVGDAGYNKDPGTAQGISDAFRDAELLAAAIDAGLAGDGDLQDELAAYQAARDHASAPMYGFTNQLAALGPVDAQMQALFAGLIGNPGQTDRFFGVLAGTVPVPEFMSPENVQAILSTQ